MAEAIAATIGNYDSPVVAQSKLLPPRLRPETVTRSALVDQVIGSGAQVAAIIGPAGSGKSTLMVQCHQADRLASWLSLDSAANDPVMLWWELIESVRAVIDGFGEDYRNRLLAGGQNVVDEVVTSMANEFDARGMTLRLYLDDLHLIESEGSRRSLHRLILHLPKTVGIAFTSRGTPPVPLARHRVSGNLLELGGEDLALSVADAEEFFIRQGRPLDSDTVETLVTRTEGWAAGLQLAAIALQDRDDPKQMLEEFRGTDATVADYLMQEVLDQVTPDDRLFMLETSILRRQSSELCDAVTGRSGSATKLRALEASNAFVIPVDRMGTWFRYHHLFAELLAARLVQTRPKEELAELHRRAFEWLRDDGQFDEAIDHALAANRRHEAADLVCAHWWELVNTGRIATVHDLLSRFDESEVAGYQPLAIVSAAVAGMRGDMVRARRLIEVASGLEHDGVPPDGAATMESSLALARGFLALDGLSQAMADGEVALAVEPADSPWRPLAVLIIGLARAMKGDYEGAVPYYQQAAKSVDPAVRAYALAELSLASLARGKVADSVALGQEASSLVQDFELYDLISGPAAYTAVTLSSLADGDRASARTHFVTARRCMDNAGQALPMDAMHLDILIAEAALELNEPSLARLHLDRASKVAALIADTGVMGDRQAELRRRINRKASSANPAATTGISLTERELEVLALIPLGLTIREIADELFLSRNTIKTYLRRLYQKLGVSSRADATRRAEELGLISEG